MNQIIEIKNRQVEIITNDPVDYLSGKPVTKNKIRFDLSTVQPTDTIKEVVELTFNTFKPDYINRVSTLWMTVNHILSKKDSEGNWVDGQIPNGNFPKKWTVGQELVVANLGDGEKVYRQFDLFEYLSVVGQLKLPTHFINGILNYFTKDKSFENIFNVPNPLFVDRRTQVIFNHIECFDKQNALYQPLVTELISSESPVEGNTDGVIEIAVYQGQDTLEWKYKDASIWNSVDNNFISLTNLTSGVKNIVVRDGKSTVEYSISI